MYRSLDPAHIHQTLERIKQRVDARFPEAGLARVASELLQLGDDVSKRIQLLHEPHMGLRLAVCGLLALVAAALISIPLQFHELGAGELNSIVEFVQVLEPALGTAFFLAALVLYLLSRERERKRGVAFESLHELRSIAHVIDMHQLTKDPAATRLLGVTAASPSRNMSDAELGHYLNYCSEMLALVSKLAALHAQGLPDGEVVNAVDEVEELCTGLSGKIWQKMILLSRSPVPLQS